MNVLLPQLISIIDFLGNYTFRTMLIGTAVIGGVSGAFGTYLYLRRQSLISDVIGHSSVAGITIAFVVCATVLGVNGRAMLPLTIGSLIASSLAVIAANLIARHSRLGIDSAMVVCLSIFFGGGMVMMNWITHSTLPNRGGITKYMFGNAATMTQSDLYVVCAFALLALIVMGVLWKEFKLFTFDPILAHTQGFTSRLLDPIMLVTITVAIVIGVKSVGLILMVGYSVMPAASARQWTNHLSTMVALSMAFGAFGGVAGSYLSVNIGRVPTGPVIVLVLFAVFIASVLLSPKRSIIRSIVARQRHMDQLKQQVKVVSR